MGSNRYEGSNRIEVHGRLRTVIEQAPAEGLTKLRAVRPGGLIALMRQRFVEAPDQLQCRRRQLFRLVAAGELRKSEPGVAMPEEGVDAIHREDV